LNNWIFSLDGWRRLLLEALQKYIAIFYHNKFILSIIFFDIKSLGLASDLDQDSPKKFVTTNNENIDLKHCFSSFKVILE
jgi:hypothetical protein